MTWLDSIGLLRLKAQTGELDLTHGAGSAWGVASKLVRTGCSEKYAGLESHNASQSWFVTNQLRSLEQVTQPLGLSFTNCKVGQQSLPHLTQGIVRPW